MKTKTMSADTAFPEPDARPTPADLERTLGPAAVRLIDKLVNGLAKAHPDLRCDWTFSTYAGWHQIPTLKQRRVCYIVPKRGDFRVSVIVGQKAIDDLRAGPHASAVAKLLETAIRYSEGISFTFDRRTLDPNVALALIEAKLAH